MPRTSSAWKAYQDAQKKNKEKKVPSVAESIGTKPIATVKSDLGKKTSDSKKSSSKSSKSKNKSSSTKKTSYATGAQLRTKTVIDTAKQINKTIKNIDPSLQYQMESGKIVGGKELQLRIAAEGMKIMGENVKQTPSGIYVKKDGKYFKIDRGTKHLINISSPETKQKIIQSVNEPATAERTGFSQVVRSVYMELPYESKAQYNIQFLDWSKIKPEEIQHYPGGTTYLQNVSERKRNQLIDRFLEKNAGGVSAEKYASIGGIYSGMKPTDPKIQREWAWEEISMSDVERRTKYWEKLPSYARLYSSTFQGTARTIFGTLSLPYYGSKLIRGKGFGPDFSEIPRTYDVGEGVRGPGLIRTGISEGIGAVTGESPGLWERVKQRPVESIFATGGELLGSYLFGRGAAETKRLTTQGLYRIGTPIKQSFVARGWMSNLPISRFKPTNLIRKAYWKGRAKLGWATEVDSKQIFQTSALPNKLSYAPGASPEKRINALFKAFNKSKTVAESGETYFIGVHSTTRSWLKPIAWLRKGRESPGVSFAPLGEGNPHFLRIKEILRTPYSTSPIKGVSLFPQIKLPTAPLLYFKNLKNIPYSIAKKGYKISNLFIKQKSPGVFTAPKMYAGGGEYEAIARGFARRVGSRYFTTIDDIVVPLPEFTFSSIRAPSMLSNIKSGLYGSSSYGMQQPVPLLSSGVMFSKIGSSIYHSYSPRYSQNKNYSYLSSTASLPSSSFSPSFSFKSISGQSIGSSQSSYTGSGSIIKSSKFKSLPASSFSSIPVSSSKYIPRPHKVSSYLYGSSKIKPFVFQPTYPPPIYYDEFNEKQIINKKKTKKEYITKYRERTWKVPTLSDLLGVKI